MECILKREKIKELIKNGKIDNALQIIEEDPSSLEEIYSFLHCNDNQLKINCLAVLRNLYLKGKIQITTLIERLENVFSENDKEIISDAFLFFKEISEVYEEEILKMEELKSKKEDDCNNEEDRNDLPNTKRDKIIIFDILKVIEKNEELKKTQIMYAANLDWKTFNRYITYLLNNKFIKKTDGTYILTPKGKLLLGKIREVFELIYPDK
ncbi:hypothetical protein JH146_1249 [Methanocaldococcus bathoardescens]|uniref:ArnR1-like winged helix-turn-helix domain-containing protein n=1 Tax=Methanocaldococcus bathoardescens TaxID=1301915 RepID=A0A076LD31_9EURY|nr:winged helix-turn-helix domain-containing protein [Methanocaldococcus bathoardescens]AIJ06091.1 hypothetical protein JH146_1249 [Methanocaldococcus bathoardescens]